MSNITDGAIRELIPPAWRKAAYAVFITGAVTVSYFYLVGNPISFTRDAVAKNATRIDKVEKDISDIKGDVADIKSGSAARDQKMDDLKDSVDQMNTKLDQVLERQHANY